MPRVTLELMDPNDMTNNPQPSRQPTPHPSVPRGGEVTEPPLQPTEPKKQQDEKKPPAKKP